RQDDIADVAFASARAVFGGQKAGQHVGRQLSYRVDRLEGRMDVPGLAVKTEADYHLKGVAVGDHGDCRLVVLAAGRNVDVVVAEAEPGQLESVPIEVGVELVGNVDALGRGRRNGIVFEGDAIGEHSLRNHEAVGTVTARAVEGVG